MPRTDEQPNRPQNILYIFTDDQSYRSVSCYPGAHPWVNTPNIDRLAREGVRFTTCYTGAWCAPSRATFLTGKLQHGIHMHLPAGYPNFVRNVEESPFWPAHLRENGWYTGIIGKWHTGPDHGHGRDWDFSAIWDHSQPELYGPYYTNQNMSINGAPPKAVGGYSTDNYTNYALDFLRGRAEEPARPWHLWLCYDAVHGPFTVADRHLQDYPDVPQVPTPEDIYPPRPTKAAHMRVYGVWREADSGQPVGIQDGRTLTDWVQQYNRAVRALDEGVGRVIDAVEAMGQLDNTLVVFTSDQGFAWGQHGFKHKFAPYDANILAPMIMRLPGLIPAGTVCETPIGGQDIPPTFLSLIGMAQPWKMHGQDLTPLLTNPDTRWDRPLLLENTRYCFGDDTNVGCSEAENGIPWWISLRTGKYKYIRWLVPGEIEEMYDLEQDPEELENLALEPECHALLAQCRQEAIGELRRTDAGMVDNLPPVMVLTREQLLSGV
ncbi:sulfatase-like hydrolase/transferase [Chloroflexi bacterium TSY]|nr:sulfatase-like hydrolase/transferase [Chloroflexi bacterium TSY]